MIIIYKEIRLLEIKILQRIIELEQSHLLIDSVISLKQFYGIEIDDFVHEIAILSLWLAEHQMNQYFEEQLAGYTEAKSIIPLKKSGTIIQGNATRLDWKKICPIIKNDEVYIIGNPPYLGASKLTLAQKSEIKLCGILDPNKVDYIMAWFYKGVEYMKNNNTKIAFVSTNSICQGEQVSIVSKNLLSEKIEIDFAYPSFVWKNNAKGNAGVTVVIIGLRKSSKKPKYLFKNNVKTLVKNINPYLRNGTNVVIEKLNNSSRLLKYPSPSRVSFISKSEKLFFDEATKNKIINDSNKAYVRELLGSCEMLQGKKKYCLYIEDEQLFDAKEDFFIKESIKNVEVERNNLVDSHKFCKKRIRDSIDYLVIPRVSSGNRNYLPIISVHGKYAFNDSVLIIENPEPIIFSILSSRMHIVWVKAIGGKLKTDYRYSSTLCFNSFPFPEISIKQKENLNLYVFSIIDERAKYPSKTLAELYNPDTMPKGLKQAHKELDEAVEKCYQLKAFKNDTERLKCLFSLYSKMLKESNQLKNKRNKKCQI